MTDDERERMPRPLRVDVTMRGVALTEAAAWSARCEALGFDGVFVTETNNDPFLPLAVSAPVTASLRLGTGVALAFPRTPMEVAYTAWNLQDLTGGRFVLGLGTQVRAHVERRFGATWSHPARRMREFVLALRAIWSAWETGEPLDFRGEFSSHTLMPPAFRPRPQPHGPPPVLLAGVRERMIEVAGEVADGLLVHPLQSPRYLRDYVEPALARGLERGGRAREAFELDVAQFVGRTDEEIEAVRRRIAFYGSTPAYRHVLDLHGQGALFERLHALSRSGGWADMAALVSDDVLETFAVTASSAAQAADAIRARCAEHADRVSLHAGEHADPEVLGPVVAELQGA